MYMHVHAKGNLLATHAAGNHMVHEGHDTRHCAVTGHLQAAVCPQTVHVVLCACVHVCLMDQLTLTTVDYTAVTLHVAIAMKV